jgi:hypothetical protein
MFTPDDPSANQVYSEIGTDPSGEINALEHTAPEA